MKEYTEKQRKHFTNGGFTISAEPNDELSNRIAYKGNRYRLGTANARYYEFTIDDDITWEKAYEIFRMVTNCSGVSKKDIDDMSYIITGHIGDK